MHANDSSDRRALTGRSAPQRRLIRITGALTALGGAAMIFSVTSCQTPLGLPPPVKAQKQIFLEQGWTAADRATYYHQAQGTTILPYAWVAALELPLSDELFMSPDNVSRYRLIPDPDTTNNPDRMPVGVTKDRDQGMDYFGLTCAACHTGQLTYRGTAVRLDGGSSQQDLVRFIKDMVAALTVTSLDFGPKWTRFEAKATAMGYPKAGLRDAVAKKALAMTKIDVTEHLEGLFPVLDGFGRQDALGRGGDNGFSKMNIPPNLAVADAPVSFPAVWEALNWDWVQYNTSIQQPLGRNIGEVLGVGGRVTLAIDKTDKSDKSELFDSSVNLEGLQTIELTVRKLKAPQWPAEVLGAIDPAKAAQGRALFVTNCAGCHDNHKPDPTHPGDWLVRVLPLDEIGTDPGQALNLKNHMLDPGLLRKPGDRLQISAGTALKRVTDGVMQRLFKERNLTPEQQKQFFFGRENNWRDSVPVTETYTDKLGNTTGDGTQVSIIGYRAHSLKSIWATPPYLHNGSVKNIYELLSPVEERSPTFYTGNVEYDPVNLGYESGPFEGGFKFSVTEKGNSNSGHEFTNKLKGSGVIGRLLTSDERYAIIEYLKTR